MRGPSRRTRLTEPAKCNRSYAIRSAAYGPEVGRPGQALWTGPLGFAGSDKSAGPPVAAIAIMGWSPHNSDNEHSPSREALAEPGGSAEPVAVWSGAGR